MDSVTSEPNGWPWPDTLDAVVAAPGSHRVVFENERTRVLEVMIGTGQREPTHTHRWPSVMLVDRPTSIRSYAGNKLTYTSPEQPSHGKSWRHRARRRSDALLQVATSTAYQ